MLGATAVLANACSLYRFARGLSRQDLADLARIPLSKLVDLEVGLRDSFTDEERRRLMKLTQSIGLSAG